MSAPDPRRLKKRRYRFLLARITEILFDEDPAGIDFGFNTEEYEPEAARLLTQLEGCRDAADAQRVVHQEFVRWFGERMAGPVESYASAGQRIWDVWSKSGW